MIIDVNPTNASDLYALSATKQQVLQPATVSIAVSSWTYDSTLFVYSCTQTFSIDSEYLGGGMFTSPNLVVAYDITDGDMTNYDLCSSCNVRVVSIEQDELSYEVVVYADSKPTDAVVLDMLVYGKNTEPGDEPTSTVESFVFANAVSVYQPTFTYKVGNMCYYGSLIYRCIKESTGNIPTNATYWTKIEGGGGGSGSTVVVSPTGTSTSDVSYITVDGAEYRMNSQTPPALTVASSSTGNAVSSVVYDNTTGTLTTVMGSFASQAALSDGSVSKVTNSTYGGLDYPIYWKDGAPEACGYTLDDACSKGVSTSIPTTPTDDTVPTTKAVASALSDKSSVLAMISGTSTNDVTYLDIDGIVWRIKSVAPPTLAVTTTGTGNVVESITYDSSTGTLKCTNSKKYVNEDTVVIAISSSSTDDEVPTAKAVYEYIESLNGDSEVY